MYKMFVCAAALAFSLVGFGTAKGAFVDPFDGASLNAAWGPVLTAPTQVTLPGALTANNGAVSGGAWNISSMTFSGTGTRIGSVYVRRDVALDTAGDFVFTMHFSATPANPTAAYGYVDAMFLDASFNNVIGAGWFDNNTGNNNAKHHYSRSPAASAANGANLNENTGFPVVPTPGFGEGTLPNSGHGRLVITKQGSNYTVQIGMDTPADFTSLRGGNYDAVPMATLLNAGPSFNVNSIKYLQLQFSALAVGANTESIPFQMSIHHVSLIPEPATFSLAALGLFALCGAVRRRRA